MLRKKVILIIIQMAFFCNFTISSLMAVLPCDCMNRDIILRNPPMEGFDILILHKSPIGEWAVISKSKDWGGGFGPHWLGLNVPWGIYGIHGTNNPWSIGRASSHGCFRMYNGDIEELYEWVAVKTRVKVIGERLPINVNKPLRPGQMGLSVMQLQDNLNLIGMDSGYRDARYGLSTETAVKELEVQYGLKIDGFADWNVLFILDLPGDK